MFIIRLVCLSQCTLNTLWTMYSAFIFGWLHKSFFSNQPYLGPYFVIFFMIMLLFLFRPILYLGLCLMPLAPWIYKLPFFFFFTWFKCWKEGIKIYNDIIKKKYFMQFPYNDCCGHLWVLCRLVCLFTRHIVMHL